MSAICPLPEQIMRVSC